MPRQDTQAGQPSRAVQGSRERVSLRITRCRPRTVARQRLHSGRLSFAITHMDSKHTHLWLHSYSGRENGLMVVGDRASIKALGEQLVAAAEAEVPPEGKGDWPVEISHPPVAGPYKDVPDFSLSFHLEGPGSVSEILPLRRRNLPPVVFIAIAASAAIGVITVARWISSYVF